MKEAPAASLTAVENMSPLHDEEEEDLALCWEGFMSPLEDDTSGNTIYQLVVDSETFNSKFNCQQ